MFSYWNKRKWSIFHYAVPRCSELMCYYKTRKETKAITFPLCAPAWGSSNSPPVLSLPVPHLDHRAHKGRAWSGSSPPYACALDMSQNLRMNTVSSRLFICSSVLLLPFSSSNGYLLLLFFNPHSYFLMMVQFKTLLRMEFTTFPISSPRP